jgi:hypothetical protein
VRLARRAVFEDTHREREHCEDTSSAASVRPAWNAEPGCCQQFEDEASTKAQLRVFQGSLKGLVGL